MTDDYTELDPSTAIKQYTAARQSELADSTLASHKRRLNLFARFCEEEEGIEHLCDVEQPDIHEYSVWRQQGIRGDGISQETLRSALMTLRVFLRWAGSVDAIDAKIPETMVLPGDATRKSRDDMLDPDRAKELLSYYQRYEYASDSHLLLTLMWHTGLRVGSIRALDVGDVDIENKRMRVRHRPSTGTPLKNKHEGERVVALRAETARVIRDYIDTQRINATDEGREPLVTTQHGRRSLSSYRRKTYRLTLPCQHGDCPHGKAPESCEWNSWAGAVNCPSSVSTHPIRRASITYHLREGVPVQVLSDRMNVTPEVLSEHYSQVSAEEAAEVRREYIDDV